MDSDFIDSTTQALEALAPLLAAEVRPAPEASAPLSFQARAYKEAWLTAGVMLEKLRVIRAISALQSSGRRPCATCDGE
jgi:hypothetical protein